MHWPVRTMRLERMVLVELVQSFVVALVALTFVLLLAGSYEPVRDGLPLASLLRFVPLMIPVGLPWTIPIAFVAACITVYSRMAGDNELTAVRATGIHLWRVLAPAAMVAVLLSAACGVLNHEVVPRMLFAQYSVVRAATVYEVKEAIRRSDPVMSIGPTKIYMDEICEDDTFRNIVIVMSQKADSGGGSRSAEKVTYVRAPRGHFECSEERSEVVFVLESDPSLVVPGHPDAGKAVVYSAEGGGNPMDFAQSYFERCRYPIKVKSMEDIRFLPQKAKHTTTTALLLKIPALADEVRQAQRKRGTPTGLTPAQAALESKKRERDRLELCNWRSKVQTRPALALSPLLLGAIAVPIGIVTRRGRRLTAFILAVALVMGGYYPLMVAASALAESGRLGVVAAVWGATGIVAGTGLVLLVNVLRR